MIKLSFMIVVMGRQQAPQKLASHAGIFRGARISSLPFVGREEIRAPLKTPAWQATQKCEAQNVWKFNN